MQQPQESDNQNLTSNGNNLIAGFKVLHKCPECANAVQRSKDSAAMECPACSFKWCWTCGCTHDHWLHYLQGKSQNNVACDLVFKTFFGEGFCDLPIWIRVIFVIFLFTGGPMLFGLIIFLFSWIIVLIYFVGIIIFLQLGCRWYNERQALIVNPDLAT